MTKPSSRRMKTSAQSENSIRSGRLLSDAEAVIFDAINIRGMTDRGRANVIIDAITKSAMGHTEIMRISNQLGRLADERERQRRCSPLRPMQER